VVDPMATVHGGPGFASQSAVSVAERLGCRVATEPVSPDEPLVMTVDGADVDLVVLVLDGAWVGRSPHWATGAWGLPARLTGAYIDKGTPVLAVAAGAGAGALAACVAQGALALFHLDLLADALVSLDGLPVEEARQVAELAFPGRFRCLLGLTAGERRVLFYLTEGWAAQDIADELVVSLTTVRSHIRSVLRKLEVRSQLAAVAIANSRDLDHHPVVAHA
jgi:DNA-binding CsgD family transcriptional regulator